MSGAGKLGVMAFTTCAAAVGCAAPNSVVYSPVNSPPRPFVRRRPADIEVFVGRPPPRAHADVGLFEVYQGRDDNGYGRSTEDMLATLRLHAGLRGCDAVQVMSVELAGRYGTRVVHGVCQMFTDEQAREAAGRRPNAAVAPLPGEGVSCAALPVGPTAAPRPCPYPLICSNTVCASPYR